MQEGRKAYSLKGRLRKMAPKRKVKAKRGKVKTKAQAPKHESDKAFAYRMHLRAIELGLALKP
jgi:hypothetical protein